MKEDELNYTDREILMSSGFDEDVPDRSLNEILKALKAKKPIEAVQTYHEVTGVGLRMSKNIIDTARVALAKQEKEKYQKELGIESHDMKTVVKEEKRGFKILFGVLVLGIAAWVSYQFFS